MNSVPAPAPMPPAHPAARPGVSWVDALQAFRYSARAAVGLLVIGYAWIATHPRELATSALGLLATVVGLLTLTAFSAFLLPVWGAHQRLVDEKARRRGSVYQRWERMLERLHQGLDRPPPPGPGGPARYAAS